jgi:GntR family transcriptional regulator
VLNRLAGPVYQQVADDLRGRIRGGEFGQHLPAEADLAHEYGVGKDTIRSALAGLVQEGLVVRRRGYRATVRTPEPRVVVVGSGSTVQARPATAEERATHGIPEGVWVVQVVDAHGWGEIYPADSVVIRFE